MGLISLDASVEMPIIAERTGIEWLDLHEKTIGFQVKKSVFFGCHD